MLQKAQRTTTIIKKFRKFEFIFDEKMILISSNRAAGSTRARAGLALVSKIWAQTFRNRAW